MTTKLAIALGQKAERFDIELAIEREKDRALAQVDLDLERKIRKLESDSFMRQNEECKKTIFELLQWYRNPLFVGGLGMVIGIFTTLMISNI